MSLKANGFGLGLTKMNNEEKAMLNNQEIIILLVGMGTLLSFIAALISLSNLFKNLKAN